MHTHTYSLKEKKIWGICSFQLKIIAILLSQYI